MFKNKQPYFRRGNILKRQMLENLRDYPREFIDIYFKDYSDGIISGAEIVIEDDFIAITKGIIKFGGRIYILDDIQRTNYFSTNEEVLIKLKFLDVENSGDFEIYGSKILIDKDVNIKKDEFELGRFKLREGANLRSNYTDFSDFATEFNTINIVNVKFAGIGDYTISPLIIKKFSNVLRKSSSENQLDIYFLMQVLNANIINRKLIIYYLKNRLELSKDDYSNYEIYKYFKRLIRRLKGKESIKRGRRTNRMIVD